MGFSKTHKHSKDYLIEFADTPNTAGWLRDLIIKIINNNRSLTEEEIESSTQQLIKGSDSILQFHDEKPTSSNNDIRFISLTHNSGVGALADNQTIKFSKNITLLYGKNGSGKSSYFKILNELVGGGNRTEIRPNIYSDTPNPIRVEVTYASAGTETIIVWDGRTRSISPLSSSCVFDSSYTNIFLQKRSAGSIIIQPYGLHLFTILTSAIEGIKERIRFEHEQLVRSLPSINNPEISKDILDALKSRTITPKQKEYIVKCYTFDEHKQGKLDDLEKRLSDLRSTNYDDKIKLADSEKQAFDALHRHLSNTRNKLILKLSEVNKAIKNLQTAKLNSEHTKKRIKILEEIGKTDSPEWKRFVEAGFAYTQVDDFDNKFCPYCRQPINEAAAAIISAYRIFLIDQSSEELNKAVKQISQLHNDVSIIKTNYYISESLQNLIKEEENGESMLTKLSDSINFLSDIKKKILESLKNETPDDTIECDFIKPIEDWLFSRKDEYQRKIKYYEELRTKKTEDESALLQQIKPIIENKSISEQKEYFNEWFTKVQAIETLNNREKELQTKKISILASKAAQTLITENLRNKFEEELKALGLTKLNVSLTDAGSSKGQSFMQLKLIKDNRVSDILSEGEQKGVALALFIAERRMQLSKNPIIMDDPVNSLDNSVISKFVDRLTKLDNQIIIFSHNLLFYNSLASCKGAHACSLKKTTCNTQSKHLYIYDVMSLGQSKKGIITESCQDSVENNIERAQNIFNEISTSTEAVTTLTGLLRHTIELIIDEKILKNVVPLKFNGKSGRIPWHDLKSLNPEPEKIDMLNRHYSRLSGGYLHLGTEATENPIDVEELESILDDLKSI